MTIRNSEKSGKNGDILKAEFRTKALPDST